MSPFDSDITAWMVVAKDQSEALVGIYQPSAKPNDHYYRLKLPGLNPKLRYHYMIHGKNVIRFGDDLEKIGLILADNYTDRVGETKRFVFKTDLFKNIKGVVFFGKIYLYR